jgi:hypothetical protein
MKVNADDPSAVNDVARRDIYPFAYMKTGANAPVALLVFCIDEPYAP